MNQRDASPTPDQALAEQAAEVLVAAGLIRPGDHERLRRGLSAGSLTAEDWITLAENALLSPADPERP